ncbi:hypothetical protein V8Z74_10410 [Comamonas sp. w2-DMI]|uniref:hypothetical protein n=1 Tax=Comamonas sp. w2-DMI TaxID=3126391 RepID=UPI0032E426B6
MSTEKNNFSRREWLMIIAIFLMAEAWILNISYSFNGEQSVINYVSFASTITSLILAVLAIVYGFYQNETGKKSNAALEAHIDAMKKTQAELDAFVISVEGQLNSVTESADKLDRIGSDLSLSVNKIDDLKNEISHIKEGQRQGNENIKDVIESLKISSKSDLSKAKSFDASSGNIELILKNIFFATSYEVDLVSVLLVEAADRNYKGDVVDLAFSYYADPVLNFVNDLDSKNSEKYKYLARHSIGSLGQFISDIVTIAGFFGVYHERADGEMEFNAEILDELRECSDSARKSNNTKELADIISKSFSH